MKPKQTSLFPQDDRKFRSKDFFEKLAEELLRDYTAGLPARRPSASKELNDAVWQTLALHSLEVAVLDSPLLQRLRTIKQLGVAHFVYPGTTHTRLEHSLGVLHQIQRLADAINESSQDHLVVDSKTVRLLRLIALCHDIGHGVMSHVAENALKRYDEVETIELEFADETGGERAKLSEIAAYYMVGSEAFRNLLKVAQDVVNDHELPRDAVDLVQKAIVGQKISDEIPLLNELISGPFDADKLDYMTRDALMAGVPVVTDIPRLIKKVRAVRIGRDDLPNDISKAVEDRPSYVLTGIALSGGRTLDELMLGRTLLFDKIYRHQKVRATEAMVAGVVHCLIQATERHPVEVPYLITDDELLFLDEAKVASIAGRPLTEAELPWARTAVELANRLRHRRLFVRAFAYAQAMPLDPNRHNSSQRQGLEQLVRDTRDVISREALLKQIADELRSVLKLLGKSALVNGENFDAFLHLDPPSTAPPGGDITRAYLITNSGKLIRFREDAAETRGWADAYLLTRETGYIFCPDSVAPFVFLAAEKTIRVKYGVQLPDSMLAYAKQDTDEIRRLRDLLHARGYYKGAAHDLRPLPARLRKADVKKTVDHLIQRLAGYQGPLLSAGDTVAKASLDSSRVLNWLRQFESDTLVNEALEILGDLRLIGRREIGEALATVLDIDTSLHGGILCPLGTWKDSSSVTTYYGHDFSQKYALNSHSLSDALMREGNQPIIFVDDILGSGNQAVSIIENWLGVPATTNLGEERGDTLSAEAQAALKGRRLAFVYSVAMAGGIEHLRNRCSELGLNATVHAQLPAEKVPKAFAGGRCPTLRARCESIGRQLLAGSRGDIEQRLLGYGNEALLVVFPYNTPTQALTCLWKDGTVDGTPWVPLFPRRKKL